MLGHKFTNANKHLAIEHALMLEESPCGVVGSEESWHHVPPTSVFLANAPRWPRLNIVTGTL